MSCERCCDIVDVNEADGLFVIRRCASCGRDMKMRELGKHGIGIKVKKGDRFGLPPNWPTLAANPLKATGHLSRSGLELFAKNVFFSDIHSNREDFSAALSKMEDQFTEVLKNSPLLADFDIEENDQVQAVYKKLAENKELPEWWLYMAAASCSFAREEIEAGDANAAAWNMAIAERFRSMHIFKEHFEDVVFMGHSAKRLTDLIQIWDANKDNKDEEFWHITFQSNSFAFAQLFSVPVTFIQDKAYVGGTGIDRKDARLVDFVLAGGASNEAILLEIKTPVTKLLNKGAYRKNVFAASTELNGSVVQVADYRNTLVKEMASKLDSTREITTFRPKCIVIAGNTEQLDTEKKRRSFQLIRTSLSGIEIVTYDELFKKIEDLASLFNISRSS